MKWKIAGFTQDEDGTVRGPNPIYSDEVYALFRKACEMAELLERCAFRNRTNEIPDYLVEMFLASIRQTEEEVFKLPTEGRPREAYKAIEAAIQHLQREIRELKR